MIYIFHGDNQFGSRTAYNDFLDTKKGFEILRTDAKEADFEKINLFLQSRSFFEEDRILAVSNFFSIPKALLDKLIPVISQSSTDIAIWQDKTLNATQLRTFPNAKISISKLDNQLFTCLNSIKPNNIKVFLPLYKQVIKLDLYDLFLYLLKNNLRKQLTGFTKFDKSLIKTTYLQTIELDFQNKTGQLSIPKEIALERILINLIK